MNEDERKQRWADAAINGELNVIRALPEGMNIHKPNSPYWQSLFRLAGIGVQTDHDG